MRLLTTILLCSTVLCGYPRARTTADIDREIRAMDSVAIAAAGIDTSTLDATQKQVLRHLLAGAWINTNDYSMLSFIPDETYYLAVQDVIAAQLREQGYVPPGPEQFRERIQALFGIAQGEEHQHLYFNGEKWVSVVPEDRYALDEGIEERAVNFHFDPERRQITTLSDLPSLTDYRNRYPQLAAVEQYIDSEKRLSLTLDRMGVASDPEVRSQYSLMLFSDIDPEWMPKYARLQTAKQAARNKFLLNGDPAGFRHMLRDYDPLVDYLCDQGGMRKPEIRVGSDIGEVLEFQNPDSMIFSLGRPGWEVLSAARGDLNGDGQDDMAVVIGLDPEMLYFDYADTLSNAHNEYCEYPGKALRSRTLIVALSEKGKQGLPIRVVQEKLIPAFPTWDNNRDDPHEGVIISDGRLTLSACSWMSAGSWWAETYNYGFEYIDSQLRLTNYEGSDYHRATGEGSSKNIDLKAGLCLGGSYNISDETESVPSDTTRFEPLPLIPIEELERGTYLLSKSASEEDAIKIYLLD